MKNSYLEVKKRQIEILKKYYEVDEEKKIVTVPINYEKASDMLYNEVSIKSPRFNDDIFHEVRDIIDRVPFDYKVNVDYIVDDYEDYKASEIMESMNDGMELENYSLVKQSKHKWLVSAVLVLIGFLVLFLKVSAVFTNFISDSSGKAVFDEIMDITGWVFIWEAVSTMFLSPTDEQMTSTAIKFRVSNFSFKDKNGNVLAQETIEEASNRWIGETKVKRFGRVCLLVSGVAFCGLAFANLFIALKTTFFDTEFMEQEYAVIIATAIIFIVAHLVAFQILGGLSAISRYRGRGFLIRGTGVFAILLGLAMVTLVVFAIVLKRPSVIISASFGLILSTFYLTGYLIDVFDKKVKRGI